MAKKKEPKHKKYTKVTVGWVNQEFEWDEEHGVYTCTSQEFVAGDEVNRETEDEDITSELVLTDEVYEPFHMVTPQYEKRKKKKK